MTHVTGEKNSFLPTWKLIFTTLEFYRECRPIKWEYHLCTRSWHESFARVTGVKNSFLPNVEIDFYYLGVYHECQPIKWVLPVHTGGGTVDSYSLGNWFLPPYQLIFTTVKIYFYHCGNCFLPP